MLRRRLSLLQAVSLNMSLMVGIGPFLTIPDLLGKMNGPHAMIAWVLGAIVALADGLVWCELAAAFPGSGGTYHFFDAVYGPSLAGRLLRFLFVWQFLSSGPLEIASGAIGLAQHVGFLWQDLSIPVWDEALHVPGVGTLHWKVVWGQILAVGVMGGVTVLAYRRIEAAGRLMLVLWLGMLVTVMWVIAAGFSHFHPALAFDVPAGAWTVNAQTVTGLGGALGLAMYSYLGYYQICYLGDEVQDAPRTLPLSILISVGLVAVVYLAMNLSIVGVIPWREVIPSKHAATDLILRVNGPIAARAMTALIVWTALASCFAALLGYSRVPYASAKAGHFFRGLAKTHPTGDFPHRSVLLVGGLTMLACLADLQTVINALLTSRILIQFVAQIVTVFYIRTRPNLSAQLKFRMAIFPLPALIALVGWLFVFGTTDGRTMSFGVVSLAAWVLWRLPPGIGTERNADRSGLLSEKQSDRL